MAVLGSATDPDGRLVELTTERWEHISDPIDGHPELESHVEEILRAVERADARAAGCR